MSDEVSNNNSESMQAYWKANLKIMVSLLIIWFIVSFGCGIIFVKELNEYYIGGFKLGFWFAQQGSMIIFVFLILAYLVLMNKLDKKYDVDEK